MNALVYFDTLAQLFSGYAGVQLYSLDTPALLFMKYAGCLYVAVSHDGAADSGYTGTYGHTAVSHDGAAGSLILWYNAVIRRYSAG